MRGKIKAFKAFPLKEQLNYILAIPALCILFSYLIYLFYGDSQLNGEEGKLTVGITTEYYNAKGGRKIQYKYCVNNKLYYASPPLPKSY